MVSIITVNFNQPEATLALLESIRRQHWRELEVIVVDNGSRENPAAVILDRYPEVQFIRSERNLGFAGGNNLGIAAAKGNYLFFVNNDTELTPDCIGILHEHCRKEQQLGAVSPLICYFPDEHQTQDLIQYAGMTRVSDITGRNATLGALEADQGQYSKACPTAYTHGAAMMVPREVIRKVGAMPEPFFLYYEELDWCEQMKRAGLGIWVVPQAKIYHKESLTVTRMGALKTYFLMRNRVLFMQRNRKSSLTTFYAYWLGIIVPSTVLKLSLKQDWTNLKAVRQVLAWHFWKTDNEFEALTNK